MISTRGIFNLSDRALSDVETKVLNKGLKFVPTNKPDKFNIYIDLQRFKRKLSLKKFFLKNPIEKNAIQHPDPTPHTTLKIKSKFYPRHVISDEIKTFEKLVMRDLEKMPLKERHYNLTREENKALKNLQRDPNIVIKPADKGGGIVILSKEAYNTEVLRILSDTSTYEPLKGDPINNIRSKLEVLLLEGKENGILNDKEYDYLKMQYTKTPHI